MKIKELLRLNRAILEKQQELNNLRKEVEELKLIQEINNKEYSTELIDITNVYIYREHRSNVKEFVEKRENKSRGAYFAPNVMCNIFSDEKLFLDNSEFLHAVRFDLWPENSFHLKHIKEVCPEVLVFANNMVPKLLLQRLYYRANGIDEDVLRHVLKED